MTFREQKKNEAQDLAGALLDAEVRIGKLLKDIEPSHGGSIDGKKGGSSKTLPAGITHKQSHYFQAMASQDRGIAEKFTERKIL